MKHKQYTLFFIALWVVLLAINFIIWKGYTEKLLSNKYDGGDLARVSYLPGSKFIRKTYVDLPKRHLEMWDYTGQKIDVLTIGDSFSVGGGFGRNSFYQDYIASRNNFTVLNALAYPTDDVVAFFQPLSTLAVLYNSGYLDRIKPRYVLIESVTRYATLRFAKPFDFSRTDSLKNVTEFYSRKATFKEAPKVFFFNNGNLKFLLSKVLYRFSDSAFSDIVVHVKKLTQPFFSVENADSLLFLHEDLHYMKGVNPQSMKQLNDNFNHFAELLEKKGIKLLYMPIVDKYDLYRDYIVDNPYPQNMFFDELRKLPKKYTMIDTKEILSSCLKAGEKDIFFSDDAHWSWKASQKIFETVEFK